MKCKKAKLLECCNGNWIFLDEYGFCKISIREITINNKSIGTVFNYVRKNKRYEQIEVNNNDIRGLVENLFSNNLAIRKTNQNKSYYYGYNSTLTSAEVDEIKANSVVFHLDVNYYVDLSRGQTNNTQEQIELNKPTDLDKNECWIPEYFSNNSLLPYDLSSLKEGDEVYLMGEGKVKISKIYGFPNKRNQVCEVTNSGNEPFTICFDSRNLFYLPYKEPKTLLDEIDEGQNELSLMPYVSASKECLGVYNVYWKPLKEASRYVVSVYKCINEDIKNIYHIADYDVDRNTCYLVLEKLLGTGFIFKVFAEDRSGKIIAKSRGITKGYPKYFVD